jgi:hypothetical protein
MILKRLVIWLLESIVEIFLLGGLLGALSVPNFINLLPGVWALAFGVGVVLFLHGFYVTTALFGVVWRSHRSWSYPAIAASLLIIHTRVIFFRLKPDLSPQGRATELWFETGGACVVFVCTFVGGWFLRKWIQAGLNKTAIFSTL